MRIFEAHDFRSIYTLDKYGDEEFVGSTSKRESECLSTTADRALKRIIGIEGRLTREEWIKLYDEHRKWGDLYKKEFEDDTLR